MKILTNDWLSDNTIIYNYLSELVLVTGNERSGKKFFCRQKGGKKGQSCLFGYTWRRNMGRTIREWDCDKNLYKTKLMSDNPQLLQLFKEFSNNYFADFEWTQVQINFMPAGCATKNHLDTKNTGTSVLVAFGNYKGGHTYVQNEKDRNYIIHDARTEPIKFDGSLRKHGVTTVTSGDRYSLVFFNNKKK